MPELANSITWLHLSDLHICKLKSGWDAHRVLTPLVADFHKLQTDHSLRPDLIFFTGDLVYGQIGSGPGESIAEQFDDAHNFLETVRQTFDPVVDQENIFIVPGNHDVNRDDCTVAINGWLDGIRDVDEITGLIKSTPRDWEDIIRRLADYKGFLTRYGYKHLLADPDRLIYPVSCEVNGLKIGIAGLNSAWSCGRNDEKGKLWMGGDWQIGELTSQLRNQDFRIALIHHPANWLKEYEDPHIWQIIERDFQFCLHGHEHQGWIKAYADGYTRIAAASCYDRSGLDNGYNFVRLDLSTGTGEVWLREYDSAGGGWVPRQVAKKTDNNGRWPLTHLGWLENVVRRPARLPIGGKPSAPRLTSASQPANAKRMRPAMGGDSISHLRGTAGTMGCLVRDRDDKSRVYLLSDSNALCHPADESYQGDAILQPGRYDGGTRTTDLIAMLTRWTEVRDDTSAANDNIAVAISQVRRSEDVSAEIRDRGTLKGVRVAKEGMEVWITGRTSGLVSGRVIQVGVRQKIPVPHRQITGGTQNTGDNSGLFPILFGDLIVCTEMLKQGDCGAILVDGDNYAVGLGFAGGQGESFFFPIQRVLDALNVDLVTAWPDVAHYTDGGPPPVAQPTGTSTRPVKRDLIYVSYSHTDKEWHKSLRDVLDQDDRLSVWDDTSIPGGADWEKQIKAHVPRARIMVMLVSPDYLAPTCGAAELEIRPALEAAAREELNVFWIPVRASNVSQHPIGRIMAAHDPDRPLEDLDADGQQKVLQSVYERMLGALNLPSKSTYKYDAFISYRHQDPDKKFSWDLVRKLEAAGFSIALDARDFSPQATFLEEMERCVKESRFTLAVTSPRYFQSGNTQEESIICKVLDMNDRKRRLIPLKIEPADMPIWLYNIVGIDFTDDQAFEDPLDKLKKTLSSPY